MSKLSYKISLPVILSGIFAVTIFIALNYQNTSPMFYLVLLMLTLFTFFFGFATGQNVTAPIRELVEKAQELSGGKLSTRVYLESKDELSELAKALNQLAEELQANEDQKKKAAEFLDMKVRARTQTLQETINNLDEKIKNRTGELEAMMNEAKNLRTQIKGNEDEIARLKETSQPAQK